MDPMAPGGPAGNGKSSVSQAASGMDWSSRPSSAPPALELSSQNLFAFQMKGLFEGAVEAAMQGSTTTPPIAEEGSPQKIPVSVETPHSSRAPPALETVFELRPRRSSRNGEPEGDWRSSRMSRCSDADLLAEVMNTATLGYSNDIEETGDTPRTPKWIGLSSSPMGQSSSNEFLLQTSAHIAALQANAQAQQRAANMLPNTHVMSRMDRGLPGDLHFNVQQHLNHQQQQQQLQLQQQQLQLQQQQQLLFGYNNSLQEQSMEPNGGFQSQRSSLLGNNVLFNQHPNGQMSRAPEQNDLAALQQQMANTAAAMVAVANGQLNGGLGTGNMGSGLGAGALNSSQIAGNLSASQLGGQMGVGLGGALSSGAINSSHLGASSGQLGMVVQDMNQAKFMGLSQNISGTGSSAAASGANPTTSMQTTPTKAKTQPRCRYYLQGMCNKGDNCKFTHVKEASSPSPSPPPQKTKAPRGSPTPSRVKEIAQIPAPEQQVEDISKMVEEIHEPADIKGKVWSLARDQNGCRRLQSLLEEGNDATSTLDMILEESLPTFGQLMVDPFGNYLVQKMFEYCNADQKARIVHSTASCLVAAAFNIHGTRAVQKLIDVAGTELEQVTCIEAALSEHVVDLIKDLNGNHVIQRCLQRFPAECKGFIFTAIGGNCVELATHRHGCCVLQRCLDHASKPQRAILVKEILNNALTLVMDPYGNYVIQYVLEQSTSETSQQVVASLLGNLHKLATQKFSSNVVEKCIERANEEMRSRIVREIADADRIDDLLHDPFGNYVVQRALSSAAPGDDLHKLVEAIRPHSSSLSTSPFGKRILTKLKKRVGNFPWEGEAGSKDGSSSPGPKEMANGSTSSLGGSGGGASGSENAKSNGPRRRGHRGGKKHNSGGSNVQASPAPSPSPPPIRQSPHSPVVPST